MLNAFRNQNKYLDSVLKSVQAVPFICAILLFVLIYAGAHIAFFTTARDNAIPLWILAFILAWNTLQKLEPRRQNVDLRTQVIAWICIVLVPPSLQLPALGNLDLGAYTALLLVTMAVITYAHSPSSTLRLLPALFIAIVIIPVQEQIFLAISFPLRLISTILTVETLQLFGSTISYQLTSIRVGSFEVAVTDACSGISQLAVLLLLGYVVVVMKHHRSPWNASLHYLSLLPIIIFANAVRLILTILLFYLIGEKAFSHHYHAFLGYIFVISSTLIFYAVGALFPEEASPETTTRHLEKD